MLCHVIETLKMATSSAVITVLNLVCKAKAEVLLGITLACYLSIEELIQDLVTTVRYALSCEQFRLGTNLLN